MAKDDLMNQKEIKKNASPFVINLCATLAVLSIFVNSIGLNLMQINGALTDHIIRWIKRDDAQDNSELKQQIITLTAQSRNQQKEINQLKLLAHAQK